MNQTNPRDPAKETGINLPAMSEKIGESGRYLTFRIDNTLFGIALGHIKEIIENGTLTPVPLAPGFVRGVFNLRGSVMPVIDLAVRLGKKVQRVGKRSSFILVEQDYEDEVIVSGFLVESVEAVVSIADQDVEPAPPFGMDVRSDFISGMGKHKETFVTLLDMGRIFAVDELAECIRVEAACDGGILHG